MFVLKLSGICFPFRSILIQNFNSIKYHRSDKFDGLVLNFDWYLMNM